jgi:hypothetical protein
VATRNGKKINTFGHPFLNLVSSDLPMSESHVVTVIPNFNNSFKLAVPDAMVGSMTQDRATGVYGSLGRAPGMIPVRINLNSSRGQAEAVTFEVARDDFLTPLLLNISVYNTLIAQERALGDATVSIEGRINVRGRESVRIERRFAGGQAGQMASASVASPIAILMRSRFDDLDITGIELDLASSDGSKVAVLDRISVDRTRIKPGETVDWPDVEIILYLVPDCKDIKATEDWLMDNVQQVFEDQLSMYSRNVRCWPKYRNQETFCEWFQIALHSRVVHLRRRNLLN